MRQPKITHPLNQLVGKKVKDESGNLGVITYVNDGVYPINVLFYSSNEMDLFLADGYWLDLRPDDEPNSAHSRFITLLGEEEYKMNAINAMHEMMAFLKSKGISNSDAIAYLQSI